MPLQREEQKQIFQARADTAVQCGCALMLICSSACINLHLDTDHNQVSG